MILSKRLSKVLNYIEPNDKVADIGADHGYLSLAMINKGVEFLQVVENKIEPLKRAQMTLENYKFVKYSLSDGISNLENEIDIVTICGMGGLNILEILKNDLNRAKQLNKLILQPNSKIPELRNFLNKHSFTILEEDVVFDKGTFYEIIVTKFSLNDIKKLSYEEILFGPVLLKKKSNDFLLKYKKLKEEYLKILHNCKNNIGNDLNHIKKYINLITQNILGEENDNS